MRLGPGDCTVNWFAMVKAVGVAAGLLALGASIADDQGAAGSSVGTSAAMRKAPIIPRYPFEGRWNGREGWVDLSFVVRPDGTVADPIVENSSGYPEFEREALKALLRQTYEPATFNGKPIEQCATRLRYIFAFDRGVTGARGSFATKYKEGVRLFKNNQIDEARALVDSEIEDGVWNLYESSLIYSLRSEIQAAQGDKQGQLQSLIRADGGKLEPGKRIPVLRAMFSVQVSLNRYADALATRDRLRSLEKATDPPDLLEQTAARIETLIAGPQVLGFPGAVEFRSGCVEGRPNFQYRLLRRKFAISDIRGNAPDLEIRCDRKRFVDSVSDQKVWAIPDSWGTCQVFVFGDTGTTLKIIEYPAEVAAAQ